MASGSQMDTQTWGGTENSSLLGYPVEWLKPGELDRVSALCCACNLVPRNAIACDCAHVYCQLCLEALKAQHDTGGEPIWCGYKPDEKSMDLDDDEPHHINFDDTSPERIARRQISRLKAVCPFLCGTGDLIIGTIEKHMKECLNRPVKCPHCGREDVLASELSEHTLECQIKQRAAQAGPSSQGSICPYCGKNCENDKSLKEHRPNCPHKKSACPVCKEQINKQDPHHANHCTAPCPLSCPMGDKPVKVQAHLADGKLQGIHATQLINKVIEMEDKIEAKTTEKPHQQQLTQNTIFQAIEDIQVELSNMQKALQGLSVQAEPSHSQTDSAPAISTASVSGAVQNLNQLVAMAGEVSTSETRVKQLDTLVQVLSRDVNKFSSKLQTIQNVQERLDEYQTSLDEKVRGFKNNQKLIEAKILEGRRLGNEVQRTSYSGRLVWKITDFSKKLEAGKQGNVYSLYSAPFYTHPYGYKMHARIFLNGDGHGKGSYLSFFFVLAKGEYDALLKWPFSQKVSLRVKNLHDVTGRSDKEQRFRPDGGSPAFQKPTSNLNQATGIPNFISHLELKDENKGFKKDDVIYVEVLVESNEATARPLIYQALSVS